MASYSFILINTDQAYQLKRGYTLLNNFLLNEISSHAKCGGKALCGRCRVKIISGLEHCNRPNPEEKALLTVPELEQGWRLACQTHCIKDVSLYLPSQAEIAPVT